MTPVRTDLLLAVLLGGGAGGLGRHALVSAWPEAGSFPWVVLAINCVGAFLLGALLVATPPERERMRALLGTGFCGAWTTFSAVAVSVDQLSSGGRPMTGFAYLLASALGGLGAVWLGVRTGRRLC